MHNWSLQSFSQDYGMASHTTYLVFVNFIHKWRELQLKVDSERRIFSLERLLMAILFWFQSFCQKPERQLQCLTWGFDCGRRSNNSTHYLLDYSDFITLQLPNRTLDSFKPKWLKKNFWFTHFIYLLVTPQKGSSLISCDEALFLATITACSLPWIPRFMSRLQQRLTLFPLPS